MQFVQQAMTQMNPHVRSYRTLATNAPEPEPEPEPAPASRCWMLAADLIVGGFVCVCGGANPKPKPKPKPNP